MEFHISIIPPKQKPVLLGLALSTYSVLFSRVVVDDVGAGEGDADALIPLVVIL